MTSVPVPETVVVDAVMAVVEMLVSLCWSGEHQQPDCNAYTSHPLSSLIRARRARARRTCA